MPDRSRPACLVAGVGPGIGLAVARRFAREGFDIALLARRDAELARYRVELEGLGARARGYAVDLRDTLTIGSISARDGGLLVA